ncbi:unnamed protein product, partial [Symbiodinium sp. CCMP2456]
SNTIRACGHGPHPSGSKVATIILHDPVDDPGVPHVAERALRPGNAVASCADTCPDLDAEVLHAPVGDPVGMRESHEGVEAMGCDLEAALTDGALMAVEISGLVTDEGSRVDEKSEQSPRGSHGSVEKMGDS